MSAKLTARRMWANGYETDPSALYLHASKKLAKDASALCDPLIDARPVAVIPLDDVEALVEKAAAEYINSSARWISVAGRMRDALTTIGVIPKARKSSKT